MKDKRLLIVLGDQLNLESTLFDGMSPDSDLVWMAELPHESTKVWSHKARIALFLSAMRHFALSLRQQSWTVEYLELGGHPFANFHSALATAIKDFQPTEVRVVEPGERDVQIAIERACAEIDAPLKILEDGHFLTSRADFQAHSKGRKTWVMEHFYRAARKRLGYLMDGDQPVGGEWNFDKQNRKSFGAKGPGMLVQPISFSPDNITRCVLELVENEFADHSGSLAGFDWPVCRQEAMRALDDFIEYRLPAFGAYQDAMWTDEPWLFHSRLSAALNLKLLNPREVIEAAINAYDQGKAPLNSVEGFVRQILGWREYVRHLYVEMGGDWETANALGANQPLPKFYWTGDTPMNCMRQSLRQTLELGYAHHIQRLMVLGLFSLLLGVRPREIHQWFLAIYVDAVEWVELPNTLGMSQYADGGRLASKPYVASGKYIERMSNYCDGCRYKPSKKTGDDACPFTVLYWDFLMRHEDKFARHPRTALQWKNLSRVSQEEQVSIAELAASLRQQWRSE